MKQLETAAPGVPEHTSFIPLSVPHLQGNEWRYIKECLDTNWVSSVGSYVDRFEQSMAERIGAQYVVATASGTSALHTALLVAGIQPDDEVLVSTLTFIAPANAIRYVGAWPVFIDAEPDYWQMDPTKVADFLEKRCEWRHQDGLYNRTTGRRVRAIIPVHILGHPVDMDPILEVARRYELVVIEDAAESIGAAYRGRQVGHLGDMACFSFNGNKIVTTGGGGMLVTDNEQWAQQAKYLTTQAKDNGMEYIHQQVGYNYRLTNIQAALGVAQLEQLDDYIAAKRRIAGQYEAAFTSVSGLTCMRTAAWTDSIYWMYTIAVDEAAFGLSSRQLLHHLSQHRIQSRPLWQPLHLSPAHQGAEATGCSVAEQLHRQALSLPCSVGLTEDDQARVIDRILNAPREARV